MIMSVYCANVIVGDFLGLRFVCFLCVACIASLSNCSDFSWMSMTFCFSHHSASWDLLKLKINSTPGYHLSGPPPWQYQKYRRTLKHGGSQKKLPSTAIPSLRTTSYYHISDFNHHSSAKTPPLDHTLNIPGPSHISNLCSTNHF